MNLIYCKHYRKKDFYYVSNKKKFLRQIQIRISDWTAQRRKRLKYNRNRKQYSAESFIWPNTTISEKQGRLLGNMCIHTTLNVVIQHSIIRHRHPAIIQSCYWMIMQPKGGVSPLPSYIYQFIIKCLDFCLDNWTTIDEFSNFANIISIRRSIYRDTLFTNYCICEHKVIFFY